MCARDFYSIDACRRVYLEAACERDLRRWCRDSVKYEIHTRCVHCHRPATILSLRVCVYSCGRWRAPLSGRAHTDNAGRTQDTHTHTLRTFAAHDSRLAYTQKTDQIRRMVLSLHPLPSPNLTHVPRSCSSSASAAATARVCGILIIILEPSSPNAPLCTGAGASPSAAGRPAASRAG